MPGNFASALVYIIQAISYLVLGVLLLRLLLPFLRADFRNPIAQAILKVTSPIIIPVRRLVPSIGRLDTATVLVTLLIQGLVIWVTIRIFGRNVSAEFLAFSTVISLIVLTINLFIFSIFIRIIISWVAAGQYSPVAAIVGTISEPILAPFRRMLPAMGGFDLSPIFAIILLTALKIVILGFQPFTA
jgi:YggT family protein